MKSLHNLLVLIAGFSTERLLIFTVLVALGVVGYALHVILSIVLMNT